MQGEVTEDILARHCFKAETAAEIIKLTASRPEREQCEEGQNAEGGAESEEANQPALTEKGKRGGISAYDRHIGS